MTPNWTWLIVGAVAALLIYEAVPQVSAIVDSISAPISGKL